MAMIPATTMQMGIDASDVPRLQKFFDIAGMELFEPVIPKHTVTVASFYTDRRLVTNSLFKRFVDANPSWRPERIPPASTMGITCGIGKQPVFR
jgi:formylglycine-generating enzyme required for sulfatase activity